MTDYLSTLAHLQVVILLGHSSVKIAEKSYAPRVKARQDQLEAAVVKTWPANTPQQLSR